MARAPSSGSAIEAFPGVQPIAPRQTGNGTTQQVMRTNPGLFPICKSGVTQPGTQKSINPKDNLSILKK